MVCLGFEPGTAGWNAYMNPLNYSGPPGGFFVRSKKRRRHKERKSTEKVIEK